MFGLPFVLLLAVSSHNEAPFAARCWKDVNTLL